MVKRVLLADVGEEARSWLATCLEKETDIQVVGQTGDGAQLVQMDELLRVKVPKPPMDSDLYISRSRKRLKDLTPEDCADAEYFDYRGKRIWNGF